MNDCLVFWNGKTSKYLYKLILLKVEDLVWKEGVTTKASYYTVKDGLNLEK